MSSAAQSRVLITLNGLPVEATVGETVLSVLSREQIAIPSLCCDPSSGADGNCRSCLVEVSGFKTLQPSCLCQVSGQIEITTHSERAELVRRGVLALLAEQAPGSQMDGASELAGWLRHYAIVPSVAEPPDTIDRSHPAFVFEKNACIQCDRCVRACQDVQVNGVIGVSGRGASSAIIFGLDQTIVDSPCVGCGECVAACPTDALRIEERTAPTESIASICPYCGVGCALTYQVSETGEILSVDGRDGPANAGRLCVKGRFGYDYAHHPERLTQPYLRRADAPKSADFVDAVLSGARRWEEAFEPVSWEVALSHAAQGFLSLKTQYGVNSLAGFGSAKGSNEEAYLFQKLIRTGFENHHVDHCTRLCHASSVAALLEGLGSGAVSNPVRDIQCADVAILIGCNPTVNHPVAATWMKQAARSGTDLIVIDPRQTEIGQHATIQLQIHPGSDIALINALLHVIVLEGLVNNAFVDARVDGFEALAAHLMAFSPEQMAPICGITPERIREVARRYATASAAMIFWGMGISQHVHGTDNVRGLIALAAVTGQIGRPGTGLHPLRGQNNVQGASDAGLIPMMLPNYQRVSSAESRAPFEALWGHSLSAQAGLTVVEILERMDPARSDSERMRGLYVMGENPAMSDPDLTHAREALASLTHLVVQDVFMTETALLADVVLPASVWIEKTGTVTNTDRTVQLGRAATPPPGDAKQDLCIIQAMAEKLGLSWHYPGSDHGVGAVFDEMIQAMGSAYAGLSWARLQRESSVTYPCPSADSPGQSVLFHDRFPTANGRLRVVASQYQGPNEPTSKDYPLSLITGRVLEHWHTGTMTRRSRTLSTLYPEALLSIHVADAERLMIHEGTIVDVTSPHGRIQVKVCLDERVAPGTVFLPFAFFESAANVLTHSALDPYGKIPEFKHTPVRVQPMTRGVEST